MAELWAVMGDLCDHGNGAFKDPGDDRKVFINGKPVIVRNDEAYEDNLCDTPLGPNTGGNHCNPFASTASSSVFANNRAAHRNNDERDCGSKTIVDGQSTVFVG
jgi:uncharacterized Zn-binding protein involved in type VI secretion